MVMAGDDDKNLVAMADQSDRVYAEQTWFTATALGINGFLMSSATACANPRELRIASTVVSVLAAFLVVQRSAGQAEKLPGRVGNGWRDKLRDTWQNFRVVVPGHMLWVVAEFSGAFFYVLVIVGSSLGVWFMPRAPS